MSDAAIKAALAREIKAFQPAMLIPRKRNATSSHLTSGAAMMDSSALLPAIELVVHGDTYSHHPASTPAWKNPIAPVVARPPAAQARRIRCIRGEVIEVIDSKAKTAAAKCGHL